MNSPTHTTVTFDTKIISGAMGSGFTIPGNGGDGEAQDDDFSIGCDWTDEVFPGDPWNYNAALSSLTFEGGKLCPSQSGFVI